MKNMTDEIRKAVKKRLIDLEISQTELAESVGKTRQQINDMLSGRAGNITETWGNVFDKLGLELTVKEKDQAVRDA